MKLIALALMIAVTCACSRAPASLDMQTILGVSPENLFGGAITSRQRTCTQPSGFLELRDGPYSLDQLKEIGNHLASQNPAMKQVPFALANKQWKALIVAYRPGDEIRYYTISNASGNPYAGGYALSRGGCVVSTVHGWIS